MSKLEIDFKVLEDEAGNVNGFSLIAQPDTQSEIFCSGFPKAFLEKRAEMELEGNNFIFDKKDDSVQKIFIYELTIDDRSKLEELFNEKYQFKFEKAGLLTPGFKVIFKKKERPVDIIREMNSGVDIPTGAEMAKRIKDAEAKKVVTKCSECEEG